MIHTDKIILCTLMLACCSLFLLLPAHAFTANSLDITIDKNGDATASFHFTLEGIIENSIPESVLEEELKKGLTTSSEPPELRSMDRSSAVLLMKKFAEPSDVPTGTEYLTASMDFKKAEIALQNSALGSAVSADFSPDTVVLTFPDGYKQEFSNVDVLPAVSHTVVDPTKTPQATVAPVGSTGSVIPPASAAKGSVNVTSIPPGVNVYLDSVFLGEAPALFQDITSGIHTVEFQKENYKPLTKNVTILPGKTTNVLVVLEYTPSALPDDTSSGFGFTWIILILALIAIAGGGYYYWSEKRKKEWEDGEEPEPADTGDRSPAAYTPVISEPVTKVPADVGPDLRNTVVRVTLIKGIPEKKPGLKGTDEGGSGRNDAPDEEITDKPG